MRPFRRGDQGAAVAEVRAKLAVLGLLPAAERTAPSASFDRSCEAAVRTFQQRRGLTPDGRVGAETYRALEEARWRLGDRLLSLSVNRVTVGDDVAELQRRLLDMGFDPGRCDGVFGARTDGALRDFQRNVGLPADGTCGPSTLVALTRLARTVVGGRPELMREAEQLHQAGPSLGGKLLVIDPGHGGADRGWSIGGQCEAEIVFDVAARIEARLAAGGMRVFATRGRDAGPDSEGRADFANAVAADLFLSLHVDGLPGQPQASGVATYYYGGNLVGLRGQGSPVGERFAGLLLHEIVGRTGMLACHAHGRSWELLRRTRMPAVRVDLGYLTSAQDAARLATTAFRDAVAEAVHAAVGQLYAPALLDGHGSQPVLAAS